MECIPRSRRRSGLNRLWSSAAVTLIVITLAACGTSDKTAGPRAPVTTSVSPLIAQRGDTITITGSNFGNTERQVLIGASPAVIKSWTDTKITATINSGTPGGPQDVAVQRKDAVEVVPGLFVGVAYTGAADGLQAFVGSLEGDTAVLLDAKTYPLGAAGLTLDRISLYGRGQGKTIISSTAAPATLQLLAGHQETLVLADLSLSTDSLLVSNSLSADSMAALALGTDQAEAPAGLVSLNPILGALQLARQQGNSGSAALAAGAAGATGSDTAEAEFSSLGLEAPVQALLKAHVLLRNVTVSQLAGGAISTSQLVDTAAARMLFAGSLHFDNATLNMPASVLSVFSSSDVSFLNTKVTAGAVEVVSVDGAVSVNASELTVNGSTAGLLGNAGILLLNAPDVQVTAESRISSSGNIEMLVGTFTGLSGTTGGQLLINDSSLSASTDQAAANGLGEIVLITDSAGLNTSNSSFTAGSNLVVVTLDADAAISSAQIMLGAPGTDSAELFVQTYGDLLLRSNAIAATSGTLSLIGIDAFAHSCTLDDNQFEVLGDGADGNTLNAEVWISCSGLTEADQASATFTKNIFTLNKAHTAHVDLGVNLGTLSGSSNQILGAGVMLFSSEPGDSITFSDNIVDAAGSVQGIGLTAAGTVTLERNSVTGGAEDATALYVIGWDQLELHVSNNTFHDFTQALYFEDESGAAQAALTAAITGNDFVFDITQAPQVAWLEGLASGTTIDARGNRWGANNDAALLEDFVWLNNTTASINLAPLKVPTP